MNKEQQHPDCHHRTKKPFFEQVVQRFDDEYGLVEQRQYPGVGKGGRLDQHVQFPAHRLAHVHRVGLRFFGDQQNQAVRAIQGDPLGFLPGTELDGSDIAQLQSVGPDHNTRDVFNAAVFPLVPYIITRRLVRQIAQRKINAAFPDTLNNIREGQVKTPQLVLFKFNQYLPGRGRRVDFHLGDTGQAAQARLRHLADQVGELLPVTGVEHANDHDRYRIDAEALHLHPVHLLGQNEFQALDTVADFTGHHGHVGLYTEKHLHGTTVAV
ncbi:MAG: hypothetical protein BWX80_02827 [Candidatus Hydrogenedentes bacterium ADurb.Bin101]|nr:MAG: hypothetical protein BWX80_02827 [Candidatus Hydrogenedentes bacterium ADurb.Bin101]